MLHVPMSIFFKHVLAINAIEVISFVGEGCLQRFCLGLRNLQWRAAYGTLTIRIFESGIGFGFGMKMRDIFCQRFDLILGQIQRRHVAEFDEFEMRFDEGRIVGQKC
jgi:hypothetical protein